MQTKSLITLAAATALFSASSQAACPYGKTKSHSGNFSYAVYTPDIRAGFIRTGGGYGYGMQKAAKPDIVDTAAAAGSFNTLVAAVKAAGLVDTLKNDGPFTVFAPTDAAFAKLPAGTVDNLLANPEKLAQILKYHVVPGKLDARAVTGMSKLTTVEGSPLAVSDIAIAKTDIMTSNGVIHVIDEVLIPSS